MSAKQWLVVACIFLFSSLIAQTDSLLKELKEVQVTGFKEESKVNTSINILSFGVEEMKKYGAFNLADGLSRLPGVSQLSTGVAISKPVIRGLYGNRVLTLLSGLRFDNQQWQDEHGLGLSDVGIDRVELIKGPMAILYGSDAVGGVLNIIEEKKAPHQKIMLDYNFRFNTNTLGGMSDIGVKGNKGKLWWRMRGGAESNADYADGGHRRVLNSRFNGYYFKASLGFKNKRWTSENNYHFSLNNFGFIFNDIYDFLVPDARYIHQIQGPHHSVMLHCFSSQNTTSLKKGILKLNAGFQSNQRKEDEGGGQISLNMLLTTVQYNLQYLTKLSNKTELIVSHIQAFENNTNYGGRIIIPDAYTLESGVSLMFKFHLEQVTLEAAAGLNNKWIKTLPTRSINTPDKDIHPFSQNRLAANGLLGLTFNPDVHWNVKLNAGSGLRSPNLAELSSNGLHEGIFTYEIGNPILKNEQNINLDFSINYSSDWIHFSGATFYNQFFNYIYLSPTAETFYGFPVYRYFQQNAHLTGGELTFCLTPKGFLNGLEWREQFSTLTGKTADGNNLPFIAPPQIASTLSFQRDVSKRVKAMFGTIGFNYIFAQKNIAPTETPTAAYYLLNASMGATFAIKKGSIQLKIIANNVLGKSYYDHLSRFKNYGIYNIGRNIQLAISIPVQFNYPTKK